MKEKYQLFGCILTVWLFCTGNALAQTYPVKPIRVIVPVGAGGAADILARTLGEVMGPSLGTSFIVENRGGAGGIVGTDVVAKAPADGYTLMVWSNTFVIAPSLYKVPYDIHKDFASIGMIASAPNLLVVNADLKLKTLGELLALARRTPGGLDYGSPAVGSAAHLTVELLARASGAGFTHVPFKGPQQAITETLGGHIPVTIAGVSNALPHIKSGKLVALATTGITRTVLMPDIPTFAEAGVKGVEVALWFGMLAPAGMPAAIIERLNRELNLALKSPAMLTRLANLGFEPLGGAASMVADAVRKEEPLYAKIIKDAAIKGE